MKTMRELAQQTLDVQNACNLTGVAHGFVDMLTQLRGNLPAMSTDQFNTHPLVKLWVDKMASLSGVQGYEWDFKSAYDVCKQLAKGDD